MFNLGFSEIFVISILALIFIGPKQLPEVARKLARVINDLKRSLGDVSGEFFNQKKQVDNWARDFTTDLMNSSQKAQETENIQQPNDGHEANLAVEPSPEEPKDSTNHVDPNKKPNQGE